jgi:hypothetical protein
MFDTTQQIRELAYHLWEERGRPVGRDGEHWSEAERLLMADQVTPVMTTETKRAAKKAEKTDGAKPKRKKKTK